MSCADCRDAEENPRAVRFTAFCVDCCARSLAQSPAFFDSERDGHMTKTYLAGLRYVFGDNHIAGHAKVKKWAARIKEAKC
jgi:hypothetical protein